MLPDVGELDAPVLNDKRLPEIVSGRACHLKLESHTGSGEEATRGHAAGPDVVANCADGLRVVDPDLGVELELP